jgi:hypothetical protein
MMPRSIELKPFALAVAAMAIVVIASNILVQVPFAPLGLAETLTWGAFTYPFAFLITDMANRRFGPEATRRIVYVGFGLAVVLSLWLATPRIALASGTAFLAAQLLDVSVFDRLRSREWWVAPLLSSVVGSALDTALFFTLAFHGVGEMTGAVMGPLGTVPLWVNLALFDYAVKLALAVLFLAPYGATLRWTRPATP